jgi:GxxExxY protein
MSDALYNLTEQIIGAAIEVHRTLGPGLLESVYPDCLMIELRKRTLRFDAQRYVPIHYKGELVRTQFRVDLVVEDKVLVEAKSIDQLHPIHSAQVLTYLKLTGFPIGLLMNFNSTSLRSGLKRLEHPDFFRTSRTRVEEPR